MLKCGVDDVELGEGGLGGDIPGLVGLGLTMNPAEVALACEGLGGDRVRLEGEVGEAGEAIPALNASVSLGMDIVMLFLRLFLYSLLLFLSSLLGICFLHSLGSLSGCGACEMKLSVS